MHGFSSTLNLRGSKKYGKSLCFPMLFSYYVNSLFPYFGNFMDFCITEIYKKSINVKCLCFPIPFPYYRYPLFPCFGNYNPGQNIWHKVKRHNKIGQDFKNIISKFFDSYCQRLISGRETGYWAASIPTFDIFLMFPNFLRC